jgi:hypothetical protein
VTDKSTEFPDGRAVLALLANEDTRRLFARVCLGQLPDLAALSKRETLALERLNAAGLVMPSDSDFAVNVRGLKGSIARFSQPRPEGVDRFVRDGRVVNYPSSDADRIQLLEWVGHHILKPGEQIDEREINERLQPLMHEHVLLRRYLIDYRVLARNTDGSCYYLA